MGLDRATDTALLAGAARQVRQLIERAELVLQGADAARLVAARRLHLRYAGTDGEGVLFDKPLTAKLLSVIVAITFSYYVNRHWTYADRARSGLRREYALFVAINGVAMAIALGTLWTSHYALGLVSPLADNISANVVGLVLGTVFRFWAYRTYVFREESPVDEPSVDSIAA